jgi:TIGR03009 family protein
MRNSWWAILVLVVIGSALTAQPAAPPAPDPNAAKLDEVLGKWEKAMTEVQSLLAFCNRTSIDKVFQTTEVFEGTAKFVKSAQPGHSSRASLEMRKKNRPEIYEKYICTGTYLYEYAPQNKVIRIHELPAPKPGQVADDNFLSFLFGMKAAEAKRRYQLTYVPPAANDKWYYYLKIVPVAVADKADFTEARLVLSNSTFLPRQLWFRQSNGNEVTWDFPKVINGAEIRLTEFATPALPAADWRFVRVPRETPARVIRQNQ